MLLELKINDFALMRSCEIQLGPGLNVLTGETGAGKSIIIDGVAAILGGRVTGDDVRQGAEHAYVEGAFDASQSSGVRHRLEDMGIEGDDVLILTREIPREGRNKCRVNGRLANVTGLRQIGAQLVDIHGQHDHQSLLSTAHHIDLLDSLGGDALARLAAQVKDDVDERAKLLHHIRRLEENARERAQREDLLRYQIAEIEEAELQEDEEEQLAAERRRLHHAERILAAVTAAYASLYGDDGYDRASANSALGVAQDQLKDVADYDDGLDEVLEAVDQSLTLIQDAAHQLRRFSEHLEPDPDRLAQVEERLELLARLKRKYGDSIAEIEAFRQQAEKELEELTTSDERLADMKKELAAVEGRLAQRALQLSDLRQSVAEQAQQAIGVRLRRLQMPEARFVVDMSRHEAEDGLPIDGRRLKIGPKGIDHVEFLFSANPGEDVRPLARIASGGEMSRVMLAIKGALAEIDPVPTLIFDEVDSGLGGRAAESVADALSELAKTHQVLVVTHLAQIAARAHRHLAVNKTSQGGVTSVSVQVLEGEARVRELARMLDGQETDTGLQHARTLLEMAHKGKTAS